MEIQETLKKEKNTSFMKNVAMLMIAQIVIKLLGFVYRLVIINMDGFGDVGNGYYNAGYQIYSLLLTISSVGIPIVISKLVSERIAIGDCKGAHRVFKTALKLFTGLGVILSLGLFFGAEQVATSILNVPDVKYVLMMLAPAIMFVAASSVLRGYLSGLGSMKPTSVSQTLEQFFNCALTITFVHALIGQDPAIMAAGREFIYYSCNYSIFYIFVCILYEKKKRDIT